MLLQAENRYTSASKQNKLFEARITDLNNKLAASNKEKEKLHSTVTQLKTKADKDTLSIRNLENSNASFEEKIRELEYSTRDLSEKLEEAEEAKILLQVNGECVFIMQLF
jgi:predicted nuclease with TOPRIM domain